MDSLLKFVFIIQFQGLQYHVLLCCLEHLLLIMREMQNIANFTLKFFLKSEYRQLFLADCTFYIEYHYVFYVMISGMKWDIGQSFEYLGYYMAGYSIRKIFAKTNNWKGIISICIGLIVEICAASMEYKKVIYGIADADLKYHIITPYSPLIVIASIYIYVGFTFLDIKKDCTKLSHITFYVYLIHAGIWDFIRKAFYLIFKEKISMELNGVVWIPGFVVIIFVLSCLLSKLYIRIWDKLDKERLSLFLVIR